MDKKTGFITGNKPHSKGGIDVIVKDTNQVINVESKEYQICKSAMESTNILFYKDKTNIEILDDIHKKYNCPAFDKTAKSGDFIVCKIAVADDKPRRRVMGTASQIVNAINGLAGGRVDGETAEVVMEKGGKIKDVTCSNCGWSWNKEDSDKHDEYVCHKCGNDNTMERGGKLIKRANSTYSKRGLWDNIRENAGSGKKPTKQMLEQEARIKANTMEDGGTILLAPNDEQIKIKWSELSDSVKNDIVGNIWDNNKYVQENYWNSNSLKDAIDDLIENYQPLFKIEYKNTNYLYNQLIELNWSISEKNIENLIEKIEDGIILDPIILNNGLFFDGGHRLTSYKRLKIENIPTIDIGFMLDFNYEKWDNGEIDFNSDTNFKNGGGVLLAPNGQPSNLTAEQYKLVRTPEFIKFFGNWEKLAMAKIKDPAMDEVTLANISKDVSKVVDENGEPLVVYHGTTKDFNVFKIADKYRSEWRIRDYGMYFSNSEFTAKQYSLDYEYKTDEYQEWDNKLEEYKKQQDWQNWKKLYEEKRDIFSRNLSKSYKSIRVIKCFLNIRNAFIIEGNGDYWYKVLKGATEIAIDNKNDGIIALKIKEVFEDVQNTYVAFNPTQIKLADGSNTTFDANSDDIRFEQGGTITDKNKEIYKKWKSLVNMSRSELENFYNSKEGKVAGLKPGEAKAQGIDSGRESARMIMKMKDTPVSEWTPNMWKWANKQISFISRMSGNKGGLYDENGNKTRKHTSLLIWGHNPEKYEKGGSINGEQNNDIVEFKTYDVQVGGNSYTESIYGGYDLDEAKRKFNQADLDDLSTSDKYSGGVVILEEKINKYRFIYDLGEDESMDDFSIEDYSEDDSIYELIEEGEYKEIETRDIVGEKDIKEQNEEQADELLNDTINYFKKLYPRYTKAGYVNRESYYFLIPIPNTDNTIELRLSNHSPNFDNIDSNKNEVIKTELVRLGENPKEIDVSDIDFYDQVYDNDMGFVKYRQIKPKNRVALINCVIYHTLDETYFKFDKNTEYNIINEYFDLNERDYELSDITEKIEEIIQEQIDEYEYNETIFKKGGKISKELKKGIKVEKEHKDTAKKLYNHEISIDQAPTEIAKDHIQENPNYYDDLEKSGIIFEDGGYINTKNKTGMGTNDDKAQIVASEYGWTATPILKGGYEFTNRNGKMVAIMKVEKGRNVFYDSEGKNKLGSDSNLERGIDDLIGKYFYGKKETPKVQTLETIEPKKEESIKESVLSIASNLVSKLKEEDIDVKTRTSKNGVFLYGDKLNNGKISHETYFSFEEMPSEEQIDLAIFEFRTYGKNKIQSKQAPKEESIQKRTASFEKTADNFSDIRQSLDEFFTPEWIAEVMFKLAQKHGFNGGKILEPSFGHGVFFDVAKKYGVSDNDMFGFEIYKPNFDYVKNNYPKAKLFNHNFEYQFINKDIFYTKNKIEKSLLFNDTQFDLVVGNPPYGKHRSPHAYYFDNKLQIRIEGFFVYLGLKKLKKGGLLIYIVNSLWLQNGDMYNEQKKEIAKLGDLIDAYRLPNKLFKDTDIATDILIFRKK